MFSILALGLLIGMQHALEADHLAAVSAISARKTSARKIISHGAFWGIGHTLTLMGVAGGALYLGLEISTKTSAWMETVVGIMLVLLGGNLLVQLIKERIHYHFHRHNAEKLHLHAHSHAGEKGAHEKFIHNHEHSNVLPWRTLLIGMIHGMAGSAALLVLTTQIISSPLLGLSYVGLFGLGSVFGMAALSALIAIPLSRSATALTWVNRVIQGGVGVWTLLLGAYVIFQSVPDFS
jgi:high-affinity nickel permease